MDELDRIEQQAADLLSRRPNNLLHPIHLSELLTTEYPPQQWVIDQLIPKQGISFVAGKPGHAKSFITLSMARAVAAGAAFAEHFHTDQGGVLMIDEENTPHELQKRARLFGVSGELPIFILHRAGFSVLTPKHVGEVIYICKKHQLSLVIIDSLIRVHDAKENDSMEMKKVHRALGPLLNTGVTVIFVHHEGKMGVDQTRRGMRGSSELDAMADSVLMVNKDDRIITITQSKLRQDEAIKPFELELSGDGKAGLSLVFHGEKKPEDRLFKAKEAVISTLERHKQLNKNDLVKLAREVFDLPVNLIRTAADQLAENKDILKETGARGAQLYMLWNPPEDQE